MNTVEIIEMPQPLGFYARDLLKRADEYWQASIVLMEANDKNPSFPTYFLICHSLECFLKSYLAAAGTTKTFLKNKLKHDLKRIYAKCEENNIPTITHLDDLCSALHEMNKDYDFRYPSGYNLQVPGYELCKEIITCLKNEITPVVQREYERAQMQYLDDTWKLKGKKIRWSD